MPTQRTPGVRGPSRTKGRDIVAAAHRLFLRQGFAATTIEDVADVAGVSKQTIYAHFGDGDDPVKDTLFRAMVEHEVGHRHVDPHSLEATMAMTHDLEGDLRTFARHHLHLVLRPDLVRLRRMLIGEAERFPGLANSWWTNGPVQSFDLFAGWFTVLDERGLLNVPDPLLAALTGAAERAGWPSVLVGEGRPPDPPDRGPRDRRTTVTSPHRLRGRPGPIRGCPPPAPRWHGCRWRCAGAA